MKYRLAIIISASLWSATCSSPSAPSGSMLTVESVSASPGTGLQAGTTFNFSVQGSGQSPLTYSWDFGDQSTGTGSTTAHLFLSSGTFTVKVTVSDGKSTTTRQTTVAVKNLSGLWIKEPVVQSATCNMQTRLTLEQSGASLAGAVALVALSACPGVGVGSSTVTGSVSAASPAVTWSATPTFGTSQRYTAEANQDVTSLTNIRGCSTNPVTQVETCNPVTNLFEPLVRQ